MSEPSAVEDAIRRPRIGMHREPTVVVATDDGLHSFDSGGAPDEGGHRVDDLAGREVRALEVGGGGPWAVVDGKEVWRRGRLSSSS